MRVAACQVPEVRDDVSRALTTVRECCQAAHAQEADVVLFPECFLQGYFTDPESVERLAIDPGGAEFDPVRELSKQLPVVMVLGLIEQGADGCHNSAVVLRDGELIGQYRKQALLDGERDAFQPGSEPLLVDLSGRRVGFNICFDLQFSVLAQQVAEQGGEVLLCPCNNMLSRANAELWKDRHNPIRADRCRESGLWLVSSDVTGERDGRISYGPTAVIDPDGRVVEQLPLMAEGLLIVDI